MYYIHNKHTTYLLELVLGTVKNKIIALGVNFTVNSQEFIFTVNSSLLLRPLQAPLMEHNPPVMAPAFSA